jgi:hypothetical protein
MRKELRQRFSALSASETHGASRNTVTPRRKDRGVELGLILRHVNRPQGHAGQY